MSASSYAQIRVDTRNIQNPSIIDTDTENQVINIRGGTRRGRNIFHSFTDFNSRFGQTINLINNKNANNIILRVNGQTKSILDGSLGSARKSNLIFINPNGITLSDNFKTSNFNNIHISTANAISFSDGFSVSKPSFISASNQISELESINFNSNSNAINIVGNGISLPFVFDLFPINIFSETSNNVNSSEKITLSGNGLVFDGAVINQRNTNLELFSISNGSLLNRGNRFIFQNGNFENIELTNNSLILLSGINSKIRAFSDKFDVNTSSLLVLDNEAGNQGEISINSDNLTLEGATSRSRFDIALESQSPLSAANRSGIFALNQSSDNPATINIDSSQIKVLSGGTIINQAGNISIDSSNIIVDSIFNDFNSLDSSIQVIPSLFRDAGDLVITSQNLEILNGGIIGSPAGSLRNAGRSFVTSENILIKGFNPVTEFPSSIGSVSVTGNNSNDIQVNANNLEIRDGATITSFSSGGGNTGNVLINATNIVIEGFSNDGLPDTGISSFVFPQFAQPSGIDVAQDLLDIPEPIDGVSGNLIINSENFSIKKGTINVSNFGGREAGSFSINSRIINTSNSRISAATARGDAGLLEIRGGLVLLRDSLITTNAAFFGEGGGISINSDAILSAGTNEISANVQFNTGGSVSINSDFVSFSEDTVLTANSQLGDSFNGEISITQRQNELRLVESLPAAENAPIAIKSTCDADPSNILINNHGLGTDAAMLTEKQQKALYLKQRINYASQFYYIDSETGEKMPYKPLLAVEEKDDGNLELIFSAEQSKGLQNLLSSLDNICFEQS